MLAALLENSGIDHSRHAVLLIDLDDFKVVNDSFGHAAGDVTLRVVSERLRESCRGEDFVGRLGGDEFVVVWKDMPESGDLTSRLDTLLRSIVEPIPFSGRLLAPCASIGCAVVPRDGSTINVILSAADLAMYEAKRQGKNGFAVFDESMRCSEKDLPTLTAALRHALTCEEFVLHFQPMFDRSNNHIVGHEALIRWHHPTRGLLAPAMFLNDIDSGYDAG